MMRWAFSIRKHNKLRICYGIENGNLRSEFRYVFQSKNAGEF